MHWFLAKPVAGILNISLKPSLSIQWRLIFELVTHVNTCDFTVHTITLLSSQKAMTVINYVGNCDIVLALEIVLLISYLSEYITT